MEKYSETQVISNSWKVFFIILSVVFIGLYLLISEVFSLFIVSSLTFTILTQILKFELFIYEDRIEYRLAPFNFKNKRIYFVDIESLECYRSKHAGMYGFKIKKNWNGSLYYMGGSEFVKIIKKNKHFFTFSTQNREELEQVLGRFYRN